MKITKCYMAVSSAIALVTLAGIPSNSFAQSDGVSSRTLEEVVVTAERRQVGLMDLPMSISAVTGDTLNEQGIVNFSQLVDTMPNVTYSAIAQIPRIFIRGVGLDALAPGADPRVAIYTDEVYNARVAGAFGTFFDLERVEVLRGPQGTLYGRNATAGAINIISKEPGDSLNGYFKGSLGNYGSVQAEGAVGGSISDNLSGRISFQTVDRDGYGSNIETGEDVDDESRHSVRAKLVWEPSENVVVKLTMDDTEQRDNGGGGFHFIQNVPGFLADGLRDGYVVPENPRDHAGVQPDFSLDNSGTSLQVDWELGENSTLTSITGYRDVHSYLIQTSDGTTSNYAPTSFEEKSEMTTQEFRWSGSLGSVETLLGAYYFTEDNSTLTLAPLHYRLFEIEVPTTPTFLAQGFDAGGVQETKAHAFFAQGTIEVTEALSIDVGIRRSSETREATEHFQFDLGRLYAGSSTRNDFANPRFNPGLPTADLKSKWSSTDGKLAANYTLSEDTLIYASFGTAFKSGGFNLGGLQSPFEPEDIESFEIGLKSTLMDGRMQLAMSAFHYDYTNLQVNYTVETQILTANAGAAEIDGFELEISAIPMDSLDLKLNISILDGKYTEYMTEDPGRPDLGMQDLSGNQLQYSPDLKIYGELGYHIVTASGELVPRVTVNWTDDQYMSQYNHSYVAQDAYALVNLFLDYKSDSSWLASLYVKNVADKLYTVAENQTSLFIGNQIFGQFGAPRTYGVSVTKSF
jgi:iron complex outermembrane receptor protein